MKLIERLYQAFDRAAIRSAPYIPFSGSSLIWRALRGEEQRLLDVGCGNGGAMQSINRSHRFVTVGVDIHRPYLGLCYMAKSHDHLVLADARYLPFPAKTFDVVICLEVLEHLEKEEGLKLLERLGDIARSKVIISTPIGHYPQHACDGNPYQEHRSQWEPSELQRLGYKLRVGGIRGTGGEWRGRGGVWLFVEAAWRVLSIAVAPLVNLFPRAGCHMVGVKSVGEDRRV